MTYRLIQPEESLAAWINAELQSNLLCILAAPYINLKGIDEIVEILGQRLHRRRCHIRILFQDAQLGTEPAAIRKLLDMRNIAIGTLEVRRSTNANFHAKCYAFRRSNNQVPTIILGSGNLTGKALNTESGELSIFISGNQVAAQAWETLERLWQDSIAVTEIWLKKYEHAYAQLRREMAPVISSWNTERPKRRRKPPIEPDFNSVLYKETVWPISDADDEMANRARKQVESNNVSVPKDYILVWTKKLAAEIPIGTLTIEVFCGDEAGTWIKQLRLKTVGSIFPASDPKTKKRVYFVQGIGRRGWTIRLRKKDHRRIRKVSKRYGIDIPWLCDGTTRLRSRAHRLREFIQYLRRRRR